MRCTELFLSNNAGAIFLEITRTNSVQLASDDAETRRMRGFKLQVGAEAAVSAMQGFLSASWLNTMTLHGAVVIPKSRPICNDSSRG